MQSHPFHKSSFRPHTLMGAERRPMLLLSTSCIGLALTSFNLFALGVAVFLWMTLYPLLVWMAQKDPDMIEVYFRNLRYPRHIPAFTSPFRKSKGYQVRKH